MKIFRWTALLGLALCCAQNLTTAAPNQLVLAHVVLIDATGRAPQNDQTVVIENVPIYCTWPAAKAEISKSARVVDAKGKILMPRLCRTEMHLAGVNADPAWSK